MAASVTAMGISPARKIQTGGKMKLLENTDAELKELATGDLALVLAGTLGSKPQPTLPGGLPTYVDEHGHTFLVGLPDSIFFIRNHRLTSKTPQPLSEMTPQIQQSTQPK